MTTLCCSSSLESLLALTPILFEYAKLRVNTLLVTNRLTDLEAIKCSFCLRLIRVVCCTWKGKSLKSSDIFRPHIVEAKISEFQILYLHFVSFMQFSVVFYLTGNIFLNTRFWTVRRRNWNTTSRQYVCDVIINSVNEERYSLTFTSSILCLRFMAAMTRLLNIVLIEKWNAYKCNASFKERNKHENICGCI